MKRLLAGFAALLFLAAAAPVNIAAIPISRMQTGWWRERFEAKQAELRHEKIDLVWYGDSITQNWEKLGPPTWHDFAPVWRYYYGDRHAINLGFKGDSTCHLLWRMEHGELDGIHPKVAILLIGANNFGLVHTDAAKTFVGIETILDLMRSRLPGTDVIVIGVLPSIRSPWVTANTTALNTMLRKALAGRPNLHFVDAASVLEHDGKVDPAMFLDPHLTPPEAPLHPDAFAQARLAALIEPLVAAGMGDAPKPPFDTARLHS